jgi:hypothetical protein
MNPPAPDAGHAERPHVPHAPERRHAHGRRSDDVLTAEVLDGYERWAGRVWAHRGKIAAGIGLLGSLAGCVVGYLGRAHDLDGMKAEIVATKTEITATRARLDSTVDDVRELKTIARIQTNTLCSLSRRLDPAGTPSDCAIYSPPRHP